MEDKIRFELATTSLSAMTRDAEGFLATSEYLNTALAADLPGGWISIINLGYDKNGDVHIKFSAGVHNHTANENLTELVLTPAVATSFDALDLYWYVRGTLAATFGF